MSGGLRPRGCTDIWSVFLVGESHYKTLIREGSGVSGSGVSSLGPAQPDVKLAVGHRAHEN